MPTPAMTYSSVGLRLTKKAEGLRLTAYRDVAGVWTIGYGHTRGVKPSQTCTQYQAEAWLSSDLHEAIDAVNMDVKVPLAQGEFDALVDFVFNLGESRLEASTLLHLLNTGDRAAAAEEFEKWDHAGGKVVAGLLRRRLDEKALFKGDAK